MTDQSSRRDLPDLVLQGLSQLEQGFTVFDRDLRLVAWNDRFLQMCGFVPALAFPGAEFGTFIRDATLRGEYGPGEPEAIIAERVGRARRPERHHYERTRPNGQVLEVTNTPLPEGGFVTIYTDITARRDQEAQLHELVRERTRALALSEARLKLIADEVPAGIAHIDRELKILYANRRFAAAYGYRPEEVIGLNATEVLHPRTMRGSERFFEQARRGALVDFEMRIELPDGRIKDIRTLLRPEKPSSGEVIGFYLLSIDVTRRKAVMSALMGAQKMDALGRMASGISHDFNNLLTIILGNLVPLEEILGEGELVSDYVAPAIAAARRGSALTQRLLTLARREQYAPEATDIPGAVEEICALLRSSLPRALTIELSSAAGVPAALVDRAQLEMALLNLALNARDATGGSGRIRIEVERYPLPAEEAELLRLPAGPYVRLRFADDGGGMSAEQVERVFEPFYTSKAAGAGSGLGLSMVYGFVKQSNGSISVESAPGQGAVFTILLPGVALTQPGAAPAAEGATQEAGALAEAPELLLLVEDDREVRRTIRRQLSALGFALLEAETGDEALRLIDRVEGIGLVLSDIDMPGRTDGFALARVLRAGHPRVAVALMSGQADVGPVAPGGLAALPLLRKPFTEAQLAEALGRARAAVRIGAAGELLAERGRE
ncbi:MAG: PAS-domain containing protein [Paenirhodobacter sp.]|uniref:hybrid sensor histidine kinase/response regulator n=1 Tax=Paenirhodobacter sp. TaxID=1965326 RepID=UPI003D0BE5C8